MEDAEKTVKLGPKGEPASTPGIVVPPAPPTPLPPHYDTITLDDVGMKSHDLRHELTPQAPGKYTVRRSVGKGGMKVVLKVRDRDAARDVAMAVMLRPDYADAVRFVQEARITANLEHPNIVPVHEIGVNAKGEPYFTMKHLSGENLLKILRKLSAGDTRYREKFTLFRLLEIFRKVCDSIAFAHSKGVLHLDLKPENIQVGEFGEVLVLDWGLAKLLTPSNHADLSDTPPLQAPPLPPQQSCHIKNQSQIFDRLDLSRAELTIDGVVKGTPGYMAPEQAAGMNSQKDERTDIYVLGAMLYAILTLKHPIAGNSESVLTATRNGEITPPRRRSPDRRIPKALEAVAMKAMALKPEDRYQKVMSLADDIDAYLNGYATSAEQASLPIHILLMLRRHKALVSSIALFLLTLSLFCSYAWYDYYMRWGKWIPVYTANFTQKEVSLVELRFMNGANTARTPAWQAGKDGLAMRPGEWLWLENLSVRGDVTVMADIAFDGSPDTLDVCVNSRRDPLPDPLCVPSGYSFRFAGRRALYDAIARNPTPTRPDTSFCSPTGFTPQPVQSLVMRREGKALYIEANETVTARMNDFAPLLGEGLDAIGLRTEARNAKLINLEVRRLSVPAKASPLVAGDSLVETMHYKDAVARYLTIAQDYPNSTAAHQALAKAYLLVDNLETDRDAALRKTRSMIAESMPEPLFLETTINGDALRLWRAGKYQEAITIAEQMSRVDTTVNMVARLLSSGRPALSASEANELLVFAAKIRKNNCIDVRGIGITTLQPLMGKPLHYLDCSGNDVSNIQPLKGMPLQVLICDDDPIINLTPLKDTSLHALSCARTKIESLDPLRGRKLFWLDCSGTDITSIKPLANMPLRFLSLQECGKLKDLSPLATCFDLEVLIAPEAADSMDILRKLPKLQYIDTTNRPGGLTTAEQFWRDYGTSKH